MSKRPFELIKPAAAGQVRSAIVELVLAHLPLGIEARSLDDELAWDILCYAALNQTTIESACLELAEAPSGNTVREHLGTALEPSCEGMTELEAQLNHTLVAQLPRKLGRRLGRVRYETAMDLVEVPYHGKAAVQEHEVRRGKAKCGTTHFHMYGTLAIVHHHRRYTLALSFVWAGEKMEEVVARLLDRARALGLRIRRAYLDKGFCSTAVLRLLRRRRLPYLIPIPHRGGKGGIGSLFVGRQSYQTLYTFNRGTQHAYTTEVVLVRKYSRGRYGRHGVRWFAYALYGLGAIPPHQIFELYRRRFGIESGYRQLHQVRARTTSRNPALRLLLVGLALLIVNLYVTLRQCCLTLSRYGRRSRWVELTLLRLSQLWLRHLEQLLGVTEVVQVKSLSKGTALIS